MKRGLSTLTAGIGAVALVLILAFIALTVDTMRSMQPPTVVPPEPGGIVFVIHEDYSEPFDAKPGDRIDVVMHDDSGAEQRCQDMGGQLDGWLCRGVDF